MKHGFTLIEIVVVVGILGMAMAVSAIVMTNSMRMSNKVVSSDEIEGAGTWVMSEIRRLVFLARASSFDCTEPSQLTLVNRMDENTTVLTCSTVTGRIASNSAVLTPSSVLVTDCTNFAVCGTGGSVRFRFSLATSGTNGVDKTYQRSFDMTVTARQ